LPTGAQKARLKAELASPEVDEFGLSSDSSSSAGSGLLAILKRRALEQPQSTVLKKGPACKLTRRVRIGTSLS
jgi:hypothetical protein